MIMNEDLRAALELVTTVASLAEKWANYEHSDWHVCLAYEAQTALTDIQVAIRCVRSVDQLRTEVYDIVGLSVWCEQLGKHGVSRGYLVVALAREMAAQASEKELK